MIACESRVLSVPSNSSSVSFSSLTESVISGNVVRVSLSIEGTVSVPSSPSSYFLATVLQLTHL